MPRTGFEHQRMNVVELTYSHYTTPDTYALRNSHTLYYNLYRNTDKKVQL